MAARVDITVNAGKFRDALQKCQGDLVELKINAKSIQLGNETINTTSNNLAQQIENARKQTKNLNNELQRTNQLTNQAGQVGANAAKQQAQNVNVVTRGLKGLGKDAKEAISSIKSFAAGLITPWTFLIIGVEAASKTFQYFWNNLSESIEKATARGNSAIKSAQRQVKQTEDRTKAVNDLIGKLKELNQLESLSDEQRSYGQSIVNRLNKEYKVFGITLDETTEKYQGLYQALLLVDAENRKAQSRGLRQQIQGQRDVVNAVMKEVFGSGLELGKSINGKDLFTKAELWSGTFAAQNADLLAKKWGKGNDLKAIRDIFQSLMDGLSDRSNAPEIQKVIDAIDTLIGFNDQLADLNSISRAAMDSAERLSNSFDNQRKAIKATREEIEKLNKQYQQNQQQEEFNALSPKEQVKALEDEVKALEQRNKAIEEMNTNNEQKVNYTQFRAEQNRAMKEQNFAQQQALQEQIAARKEINKQIEIGKKNSITALKNEIGEIGVNSFDNRFYQNFEKNPQAAIETANRAYHDAVQGLSVHQYSNKDKLAATYMKQFADKYQKILEEANNKIEQNNQLNLVDQHQFDALAAALEQAEKDAKEFGDIAYQAEQEVVDAEKERINNLLKVQQITGKIKTLNEQIADAEKRAAEEARKASEALWEKEANANKSIQSQVFDIQNQVLRKKGQEREALVRQNIQKIEQQLGRPLQEMDAKYVKAAENMADIQMALNGLNNNNMKLQSDQVYANELARMGGFSSSIVVDRMDINKEILNTNRSSNQYLNNINTGIQNIHNDLTF